MKIWEKFQNQKLLCKSILLYQISKEKIIDVAQTTNNTREESVLFTVGFEVTEKKIFE
jgi:hypothetical protein